MQGHGIRYTVATEEDVENLEQKWSFRYGSLILDNVIGHYEASIVDALPAELRDILRNVAKLRVVSRNGEDMGDLFYTDTRTGTTIEIYHDASGPLFTTDFETLKFLELLTRKELAAGVDASSLISVDYADIYHDVDSATPAFLDYLVERYPDVRTHMYGASMIELGLDMATERLNLRVISKIPQTLKLPESTALAKTEVGIVQRQKRHLQDSEFKGLSAFLPATDLSMTAITILLDLKADKIEPFMIFFDQRLRPLGKDQSGHITSILGAGSHRTFHTVYQPSPRSPGSNCQLYAEYHLPKQYFFDPFELQQLYVNRTILHGEHDLEAPTWKVSGWGSILYVALDDILSTDGEIKVPFHARYHEPSPHARRHRTKVLAPQVFAACHQPDQAFSDNPWESATLKSQVLGDDYRLRFLPNKGRLFYDLSAAVANEALLDVVAWSTSVCILLGLFYVLFRAISPLHKQQIAPDAAIVHKKTK